MHACIDLILYIRMSDTHLHLQHPDYFTHPLCITPFLLTYFLSSGQDIKEDSDKLKTRHERVITYLQDATPPGAKKNNIVSTISSSSLDGRLIIWHLPDHLDIKLSSLSI